MISRPTAPSANAVARPLRTIGLAALAALALSACVPVVPTPTPAAPVAKPPAAPEKIVQATTVVQPASSPAAGGTVAPGLGPGYPLPGPNATPPNTPTPPTKGYP